MLIFLHDNGTDLQFGDKDEPNVYKKRFNEQAWNYLVNSCGYIWSDLKCCIWDWGDRFTKPNDHLNELGEHIEHRLLSLKQK